MTYSTKGQQRQDLDMFEHNVKYNSKVQKELKVLSKAGDMTTDFFKRERERGSLLQ